MMNKENERLREERVRFLNQRNEAWQEIEQLRQERDEWKNQYVTANDNKAYFAKLTVEWKEKAERLEKAFEKTQYAIYTQYSTINAVDNTENERGQISGLIQANNIFRRCFSE